MILLVFDFSKINRETGPAAVGIEVQDKNDLDSIEEKLTIYKFNYQYLN